MRRSDGTLLYYHTNHLGSTHIVTNSSGSQVEEIHYEPFGKTFTDTGSTSVNHKYTSQEFDSETGLYYYRARYYDPELGRFIQADAIGTVFANPQTLNRYSYTNNNPMTFSDPMGHCEFSSFGDFGDCFVQAANWVDENIVDPVADFFTDNIIDPVANFLGFGGESEQVASPSPPLPGINPYTGVTGKNPFSSGASSGGPRNGNQNSRGGIFSPRFVGTGSPLNSQNRRAIIDLGSIVVSGQGLLTFNVLTSGLQKGENTNVLLEQGFVDDVSGSFSNPNFRPFGSPLFSPVAPFFSREFTGIAQYNLSVTGIQGPAYLRITPDFLPANVPPPILTNFAPGGGFIPCNPCDPLFGYGGP